MQLIRHPVCGHVKQICSPPLLAYTRPGGMCRSGLTYMETVCEDHYHCVNRFSEATSVCSAYDHSHNKYSLLLLYADPLPNV